MLTGKLSHQIHLQLLFFHISRNDILLWNNFLRLFMSFKDVRLWRRWRKYGENESSLPKMFFSRKLSKQVPLRDFMSRAPSIMQLDRWKIFPSPPDPPWESRNLLRFSLFFWFHADVHGEGKTQKSQTYAKHTQGATHSLVMNKHPHAFSPLSLFASSRNSNYRKELFSFSRKKLSQPYIIFA